MPVNYILLGSYEYTSAKPDHTQVPPGTTFGTDEVPIADLTAFVRALHRRVVTVSAALKRDEIQKQAKTFLASCVCGKITDVIVNDSRPGGDSNPWKQDAAAIYCHPVTRVATGRTYIAVAQDPTRVWVQASVTALLY